MHQIIYECDYCGCVGYYLTTNHNATCMICEECGAWEVIKGE